MKNFNKKRAGVLLAAIALLLTVAVGGTVAYLAVKTGSVVNTFAPTGVDVEIDEDFTDGTTKKDVVIKNYGNIAVYVRAKIVITWQDEAGNVYGHEPVSGTDYKLTMGNEEKWFAKDGFWYYSDPVAPMVGNTPGETEILIDECTSQFTEPDGYNLHVEILAQAIQAAPTSVVATEWGVTVASDGTISN